MVELVAERERKPQLTLGDRKALYFMIQCEVNRGSNFHGLFKKVSENFRVAPRQASRVYKSIRKKVIQYLDDHDEPSNTILLPDDIFKDGNGNRGAKKKWCRDKVVEDVKKVPLRDRGNVERLSRQLGIPVTTVRRMKKQEGILRSYRSSIKPKLTEENIEWRLDYAWSKVDDDCFAGGMDLRGPSLYYQKMYNDIHVDEKWFYLIKEGRKFILTWDEEEPYITQQHKGTIPKVMFLCALARPRYITEQRRMFDGKIGIWPIGHMKPAARSSVNRPAGTLEWESVKVDRDEYRDMMICKVLPAIIEKWPTCVYTGPPITIQQDGARPHFRVVDGVCLDKPWNDAVKEYGLEGQINVITQPANSPDLNVNDLGFFNSLQTYYWQTNPKKSSRVDRHGGRGIQGLSTIETQQHLALLSHEP